MNMVRVAFYSPMGGVHRTTTALLTGLFLAEKYETPTIVIDFDIETPGIYPYVKVDKDTASVYRSYLAGRLIGKKIATHPLSSNLFIIPSSVDPLSSMHLAYTLGYTVGRLDGSTRLPVASVFDAVLEDAVEKTGAKLIIIDLGPGMEGLTLLTLRYLVKGYILLTRSDGISRTRLIEVMKNIAKSRLIDPGDILFTQLVMTAIPLEKFEASKCSDEIVLRDITRSIVEDTASTLERVSGLRVVATHTLPLISNLLEPETENPVTTIWKKRDEYPFCLLARAVDKLAKTILQFV